MGLEPTFGSEDIPAQGNLKLGQEFDLETVVSRLRTDSTTGEPIAYPPLQAVDDLLAWANRLRKIFKAAEIPKNRWPDAALLFLSDTGHGLKIRILVEQTRSELNSALSSSGKIFPWDWDSFLEVLKEVLVSLEEPNWFKKVRDDHRDHIRIAGKVIIGAGAVALGPVAAVAALNALGFSAAGVVGGSIAAGLQSSLYGGLTTGIFSTCQSIAASAAAPALGTLTGAAGAILAGVGILDNTGEKSDTETKPKPKDQNKHGCKHRSSSSSPSSRECVCKGD